MRTSDTGATLGRLFSELVDGTVEAGAATILNTGDVGLLRSLDRLSAAEVDARVWDEIRAGLRDEAHHFLAVLREPREVNETEFGWLVGTIAHLAYHLGAIRQIDKQARGPKEGTLIS